VEDSGGLTHQSGVNGVFVGEYQHTIDEKNRLIIPAKFREDLGAKFIATRGLDNCLFIYPMAEWQNIENKLKALPFTNKDARAFVRFFFSGACECELDKQGRINIPQSLRDYAKLEKEVVVIGVSSRIEIWSKECWNNYLQQTAESYEALAEELVDLGI